MHLCFLSFQSTAHSLVHQPTRFSRAPKSFRHLACLTLIALFAASLNRPLATAAILPTWDQESPVTVYLPATGVSAYIATGAISLGSFDVVLVYDVSGSMAFETPQIAPNGGSQRGDWARDGANAFVDGLPAPIRLGLNQFAGPSSVVIEIDAIGELDPLSPHRTALRTAINSMPRNGVTGTNIANAISFAAQVLNSSGANTDSKHIVLVTDGDSTSGNPVNATSAAVSAGINTVNTIALPGANVSLLMNIANAGNGTFVDGTNPSNLIAGFTQILNDAETLEKLDLLFPDGTILENYPLDADGGFSVALPVVVGDNLFTARATSNLGNVHTADILIQGILVPEPSSLALAILSGMTVVGVTLRRRKSKLRAPEALPIGNAACTRGPRHVSEDGRRN